MIKSPSTTTESGRFIRRECLGIAMPWVAHMPGLAAAPVVGADGIIEFAVFEIAVRK